MRLKINLQSEQRPRSIPINYQYYLSSVIYYLLAKANLKFSTELHDGGHLVGVKKFKFFTFSWLQIPQKKISGSSLVILSSQVTWYISSPWMEFIQYLVNGLLELVVLKVSETEFEIVQVETLPDPFNADSSVIASSDDLLGRVNLKQYKFSCLSPLVVTTKKEYNGKLSKYFYRPADPMEEISEKICNNLKNKYNLFYGKEPDNAKIKVEFDTEYKQSNKSQVLIHYKENSLDIKIPATMCPFTVTGSVELIRFGYDCGFGEENSAGFGMVKLINQK